MDPGCKRRRISIVTGCNAGIGKEITAGLLERDENHVIMACRRLDRCEEARAELASRGLPGASECSRLDLADYSSIRGFAAATRQRLRSHDEQLHVLVNNAGIIGLPARSGEDQQLRVNHLGPFLLTRLLLPCLASGARVVNVSSRAHQQGSLRIKDNKIVGTPGHWYLQYARSKLCNVLHAHWLQQRCVEAGLTAGRPMSAYAVSPGRVNTRIFDNLPPLAKCLLRPLASAFFQTPKQGASTVLYAATAPQLEGSGALYLHNMRPARASRAATDDKLANQLWQASLAAVGWSAEDEQACQC